MTDNSADARWMDERDPELQPGLTRHIELEIESGDTFRELLAKAAWALRTTAVPLEAGKFEDGFHPIRTLEGEEIGKVYIRLSRIDVVAPRKGRWVGYPRPSRPRRAERSAVSPLRGLPHPDRPFRP